MATYDDLNPVTRLFLKRYPFSRYAIAPAICAKLDKPLGQARIALVTTAGLHSRAQKNFDYLQIRGDWTFREIPGDADVNTLTESHRSTSFDHRGVEADKNLALPLDRLRELKAEGVIGNLNQRHFSFMGSIIGPQPLIDESAPEVARRLRDDKVDGVLLTPV